MENSTVNFNPYETLNSLYIRDNTDIKYNWNIIENKGGDLEELIAKIKIILYTRRGQVLGVPDLGMDLEGYLFNKSINTSDIRNQFYTQLASFCPEAQNYNIQINIRERLFVNHKQLDINITIDNVSIVTRRVS